MPRTDVNQSGRGFQGGYEQRIEVILKMQKGQGGVVVLSGGEVRVDVNQELKEFVKMQKSQGREGPGRGEKGSVGTGVRVDVNQELK